jgi:hypothetical protein
MFESAFERRCRDLAKKSGLKIAEIDATQAKLLFEVNGHTQPLFIMPYEGVWEFSCPTMAAMSRSTDFPTAIMAFALEHNSGYKRGFWCIEELGRMQVLEYMHNVPPDLLTPGEFGSVCWHIVKQVEALECALAEVARRM